MVIKYLARKRMELIIGAVRVLVNQDWEVEHSNVVKPLQRLIVARARQVIGETK